MPPVVLLLPCDNADGYILLQLAENMFRQHTRKLAEKHISAALVLLKSRNQDMYEQYHILCYNFSHMHGLGVLRTLLSPLITHIQADR